MELTSLSHEFYLLGRYWFLVLTMSAFGFLVFIQLCWLFYRWISDAKTEWSDENKRHTLVFGDVTVPIIDFSVAKDEVTVFYVVICVSAFVCLLASLVWPVAVIAIACMLVGLALRGTLRFKRSVSKALGGKADKGHNHDDTYDRKKELIAD